MSELRVPLFPLPDVVFFPETVLPLHVFEPRYRRLVADCLAGDGRLAVVKLEAGEDPDRQARPKVHRVAGLGDIVQAERLADGRFNVLLYGRSRIRIEAEEPPGELLYRVARARRLDDVAPRHGYESLVAELGALRAIHGKLLAALGQAHPDLVGRLTVAGAGAGAIVDRIASAVIPDAEVRQGLLETADVGERLAATTEALVDLLAFVVGSQGEGGPDED